jgi:hypothetical protein
MTTTMGVLYKLQKDTEPRFIREGLQVRPPRGASDHLTQANKIEKYARELLKLGLELSIHKKPAIRMSSSKRTMFISLTGTRASNTIQQKLYNVSLDSMMPREYFMV